jgi:hypothetical protein
MRLTYSFHLCNGYAVDVRARAEDPSQSHQQGQWLPAQGEHEDRQLIRVDPTRECQPVMMLEIRASKEHARCWMVGSQAHAVALVQ